MSTLNAQRGLLRFLTILIVLSMLLGGLPAVSNGYQVSAQEGGGADIGDPPTLESFTPVTPSSESIELAAAPLSVDTSLRSASRAFFNEFFVHEFPSLNWTGDFATCNPGTISASYRQKVLDQIAWYRVMAGVSGVASLSSAWNAKAQQAALMMGKAGSLSHYPLQSWPCFTTEGREAAMNSNIAFHYRDSPNPPVDFVTQYIEDSGSNNAAVGHRRWLLFPQTTTFGVGSVPSEGYTYPSANAIWVNDGNYSTARPGTRDGFVAWPPPGYVPYQVVFPRWSFSFPGADFSGSSVSATRNGSPQTVTIDSNAAGGAGENTIVFVLDSSG